MKVSIYENVPVKAKELEFKLKLFKSTGCILVALADEKGERINDSSLVVITNKMEIIRCSNIGGNLGIPLVSLSRLKLVGEDG